MDLAPNVAFVDSDSRLFGDSIRLRSGSQVYDISYNQLLNQGGQILGTQTTPLTLPDRVRIPQRASRQPRHH